MRGTSEYQFSLISLKERFLTFISDQSFSGFLLPVSIIVLSLRGYKEAPSSSLLSAHVQNKKFQVQYCGSCKYLLFRPKIFFAIFITPKSLDTVKLVICAWGEFTLGTC